LGVRGDGLPKGQSTLIAAAEGFLPKDGNLACTQEPVSAGSKDTQQCRRDQSDLISNAYLASAPLNKLDPG